MDMIHSSSLIVRRNTDNTVSLTTVSTFLTSNARSCLSFSIFTSQTSCSARFPRISGTQRSTRTRRTHSRIQTSKLVFRRLATHSEPPSDIDLIEEIYQLPIPTSGYTSRHVLSIFPPLPVLDKMQEIQAKLATRTRILPIPRANLQVVLIPLGTSLADPGKLTQAKLVRFPFKLSL